MSAQSRRPSLGAGLVAAIVLSTCGAALLSALSPWLGGTTALRVVIALLGFSYVLYAIARSGERVGRLTTVAAWLVAAAVAWILDLPLAGYALYHLVVVSAVRSLYYCSGLLPALTDLALSALGAAFAVWAAQRSGSAWLALWCFFLAQAFHVLIPLSLTGRPAAAPDGTDDAFARAHRAAEAAVRRLTSAR